MADADERAANETVLVAYVTAHLLSGDTFELLPFEDADDVKTKVSDLLADWAKSGFLIRGSDIVPWHQVRRVEELSRGESALRRKEWEAHEVARWQQSYWRTKRERKQKEEKSGEEQQDQAAWLRPARTHQGRKLRISSPPEKRTAPRFPAKTYFRRRRLESSCSSAVLPQVTFLPPLTSSLLPLVSHQDSTKPRRNTIPPCR